MIRITPYIRIIIIVSLTLTINNVTTKCHFVNTFLIKSLKLIFLVGRQIDGLKGDVS
jgi:hypothetical protein